MLLATCHMLYVLQESIGRGGRCGVADLSKRCAELIMGRGSGNRNRIEAVGTQRLEHLCDAEGIDVAGRHEADLLF